MRLLLFALPLLLVACEADVADPVAEPVADESALVETETEAVGSRLNLNTATEDEFKTLGVGDQMAHEFAEYQPYNSVREFRQEIGKYINDDADQLAEYETMVFVPVDPNASDAETLQQIDGVDAEAAQAMIDGRPFDSDQAFVDALLVAAPTADADDARTYLAR